MITASKILTNNFEFKINDKNGNNKKKIFLEFIDRMFYIKQKQYSIYIRTKLNSEKLIINSNELIYKLEYDLEKIETRKKELERNIKKLKSDINWNKENLNIKFD